MRYLYFLADFSFILAITGCGDGTPAEKMSSEAALGQRAFFDPLLSASGTLSCASCHASETGHASPGGLAVELGGVDGHTQGVRSSQTLRYLAKNTPFHFDANGTPTGGFFWDGRANTLAEQALGPLLNPLEMANTDAASVAQRIAKTTWAPEFKALYGAEIFLNPDMAVRQLAAALQRYQEEDTALNAYTSKYDAVLRGTASLNAPETRGLALFNDAKKGNCASCHTSARGEDGSLPLFTDFTYDNLGIPRNPAIAANAYANYFDAGLCGRPDLKDRTDLCGAFKVPTLRNVALRKVFFHNGVFHKLRDVVAFYVQRDTHPEKWYPLRADGTVDTLNDLRPEWKANVNTSEAPYDRHIGDSPALNDAEIGDVVAFLQTLSDGWTKAPTPLTPSTMSRTTSTAPPLH